MAREPFNEKYACICLCRSGFEDALAEEVRAKIEPGNPVSVVGPGLVGVAAGRGLSMPPPALIFERQRLSAPGFVCNEDLKPLHVETVRRVLGGTMRRPEAWTIHAFAFGDDPDGRLSRRIGGIEKALLRLLRNDGTRSLGKLVSPREAAADSGCVVVYQLCLTREGLWYSQDHLDRLPSAHPAGLLRMNMDRRAPSRSYMKIEEAFATMQCWPEAGQTAIDLGAAPGGWTYAFVKRGCSVTAVDRGSMRLPPWEEGWGTVRHLRANGITYEPGGEVKQVDWLVSDMLVSPGVAFGLLKRWVRSGRMDRFVCNVKIPQQEPYAAVRKLEAYLRGQRTYDILIRQLYHDRREITIMGRR